MAHADAKADRVGSDVAAQSAAACAIAVIALAVPVLALLLHLQPTTVGWVVILGYTFLALGFAKRQWRSVASRRYGRRVEAKAISVATRKLPRYGVQVEASDKRVAGIGDIDMLVAGMNGRAAVEIKSFHLWDEASDRCRAALRQVQKEAAASHADYAVIWLPVADSGPRTVCYNTDDVRNVLVVAGPARILGRTLRGVIA